MGAYTSLKNHLLIAMPSLADPNFAHSVTYICEHSPEGAMGIIINYPLTLHLGEVLQNMEIATDDVALKEQVILAGGPIQQERGFVIHRTDKNNKWKSSMPLSEGLAITTSKDILQAMANNTGPKDTVVALGYSRWGAGQLEQEIAQNSWLCAPASLQILFDIPVENRWHAAAALMGVDLDNISTEIGHA